MRGFGKFLDRAHQERPGVTPVVVIPAAVIRAILAAVIPVTPAAEEAPTNKQ